MRAFRTIVLIILTVLVAAGIYLWRSQGQLIDKIEPPSRSAFAPALIAKGARLAALGDCHVCHTATDGEDYAGNRSIPTPFGTIYSTNITPAPGSGIGHWSLAAFSRAMRHGISRTGEHLYPAFPYPHFAMLGDADIDALYAYLMTRRPIETAQLPNKLKFPLGQRWVMSFWNLLFFHPAPFRPDLQHDAEWNRGAYLVEGLGHCGDCHTPRNLFGAEATGRPLAGGDGEGWTAPALAAGAAAVSPAPGPWSVAQLVAYLSRGGDRQHGAAAGPMQSVAAALANADPADAHAIAVYIASQEANGVRAPAAEGPAAMPQPGNALGAALFAGACARCHAAAAGESMLPPHGIDLAHSTAVNQADPRDAILIVLGGIHQPDGQAGPSMPGFADALTDAQIAALLSYVRAHDSPGGAWPDLEQRVHVLRRGRPK